MPRQRFKEMNKPLKTSASVFPTRIGRIEYIGRWIITILITIPVFLFLSDRINYYILATPIVLFALWFSEIPRIRDIGWSPWIVLFEFIPVAGNVLSLILLFVPGKE